MMRWWENDVFLKRRTTSEDEVLKLREELIREEDAKIRYEAKNLRKHKFRVEAPTSPLERVGVTGNCAELGLWEPEKVVLLDKEGTSNIWSKDVMLPILTRSRIKYRYVVVSDENYTAMNVNVMNGNTVPTIKSVRRWEASPTLRKVPLPPRSFQATSSFRKEYLTMSESMLREFRREKTGPPPPQKFGFVGNTEIVERGWLTCDSALQIKLFGECMKFVDKKLTKSPIYTKIRTIKVESSVLAADDFCEEPSDGWPVVEVSSLNENDRMFKRQDEYGFRWCGGENVIYNIYHESTETLGIIIDFYVYAKGRIGFQEDLGKPYHRGVACLHPCMIADKEGEITTNILSIRGSIIGNIKLKYALITKPKHIKYRFNYSLPSVWKTIWTPAVGTNLIKTCSEIRDNTLSSIESAVAKGFNYVEIAIQFTRDHIPVFGHSKYIVVAIKYPLNLYPMEQHQVEVGELTLAQLHRMRVLPIKDCSDFLKLSMKTYPPNEVNRPFPTLMQLLNGVDKNVGFIIQMETMTLLENGTYENYHRDDWNVNAERLLKTLTQSAGRRDVILTSFHPDICSMFRMKQNMYPIIFLQEGVSTKYPAYDQDVRCKNLERAVHFAVSMGIHGIGLTNDTIMDPYNASIIRRDGLVAFCTDELNDTSEQALRDHLNKWSIDGILSTRHDEYGLIRRTLRYVFEPKKNEDRSIEKWAEMAANDGYQKPEVPPLEHPNDIIVDLEFSAPPTNFPANLSICDYVPQS